MSMRIEGQTTLISFCEITTKIAIGLCKQILRAAIEGQREPERARGSQGEPERARESKREPESEPERARENF